VGNGTGVRFLAVTSKRSSSCPELVFASPLTSALNVQACRDKSTSLWMNCH
jgi:hypothetical protein